MNITVKIDAADFTKWLAQAPDKVAQAMGNIITKTAFLIERESKFKTPVDTGRLRSSIAVSLRPLMATIEPHVNYALYVHEGTRFMRGRPFMKEGVDIVERLIPGIVNDELKKL